MWRGLGEEEGLGNVNVVKREGTRDSKVPWSIDIEREREAVLDYIKGNSIHC